jgi:hypothetical protein
MRPASYWTDRLIRHLQHFPELTLLGPSWRRLEGALSHSCPQRTRGAHDEIECTRTAPGGDIASSKCPIRVDLRSRHDSAGFGERIPRPCPPKAEVTSSNRVRRATSVQSWERRNSSSLRLLDEGAVPGVSEARRDSAEILHRCPTPLARRHRIEIQVFSRAAIAYPWRHGEPRLRSRARWLLAAAPTAFARGDLNPLSAAILFKTGWRARCHAVTRSSGHEGADNTCAARDPRFQS